MKSSTIWVVHESDRFRAECLRNLRQLGLEATSLRWKEAIGRVGRGFPPDDWVLADHGEVERLGAAVLPAMRTLGRRLILLADRELAPEELSSGWVVVRRPFRCEDLARALGNGFVARSGV